MPSKIVMEDTIVSKLFADLARFHNSGIKAPMTKGAEEIKDKLQKNIVFGKTITGNTYPQIRDVTKEMEIARSGPFSDSRKRSEVSRSPIAMDVTGQSFDSITVEAKSVKEVNVGYNGIRADVVFRSNAKGSGNINKPKRDPLGLNERIASDFEFDAVADAIEDALERAINGV